MDNENQPQTMDQKLMIVSSQYPDVVIQLLKSVMDFKPLIADTEFATVVNAVTFDVRSDIMMKVTTLMNDIKNGSIFENKLQ